MAELRKETNSLPTNLVDMFGQRALSTAEHQGRFQRRRPWQPVSGQHPQCRHAPELENCLDSKHEAKHCYYSDMYKSLDGQMYILEQS